MAFSLDVETRSPVNLKTAGMYVYFEHPKTNVMIASWAVKGGPRGRWRLGEPCPPILVEQIEAGETITCWNAGFERRAIWDILVPRHGWPRPKLEQFVCTAAAAAAIGLPRALDDAAVALGLDVQKDAVGKRLMLRMSKPRNPRAGEDPNGLYWYGWDDDALVEQLSSYCDQDVVVEEAVAARIVPLSPAEQRLYWTDQLINDRGIRLDRLSAAGAVQLAERAKAVLDREMALVTAGYVRKCSAVADLTRWVREQGVALDTLGKADVVDLLEADDLPERVRRALEIRQEAAKTSVKKIDAMRARACRDGRIRGSFLFCAAGTGRWSSTGAQLHNMPRPRKVFEDAHVDYRLLFEKIRTGDPEQLREIE